jgi:hypothetical protein
MCVLTALKKSSTSVITHGSRGKAFVEPSYAYLCSLLGAVI